MWCRCPPLLSSATSLQDAALIFGQITNLSVDLSVDLFIYLSQQIYSIYDFCGDTPIRSTEIKFSVVSNVQNAVLVSTH